MTRRLKSSQQLQIVSQSQKPVLTAPVEEKKKRSPKRRRSWRQAKSKAAAADATLEMPSDAPPAPTQASQPSSQEKKSSLSLKQNLTPLLNESK